VAVGVTELVGELGALVPRALVAVTVKVYAVPFVRPCTAMGVLVPFTVIFPGYEVTV